jgi:hypothetical protein
MARTTPDPQDELDISWRTRELGPEVRRALFKKIAPTVKLASEHEPSPHAQGSVAERRSTAAPEHGRSGDQREAPRSRDGG